MTKHTTQTRRAFLGAAGSAAVLALAGCTSSANSTTSTQTKSTTRTSEGGDFASEQDVNRLPSAPAAQTTVEMTMVSEKQPVFAPEVTWVKPGGSVTWKNVDEDPHTTTAFAPSNDKPQRIPDGADGWDSGILKTDQTFTQAFDTAGVYEYYCTPHESLGMVGVVIVGQPDTAGQPAMIQPQDSIPKQARSALATLQKNVETVLSG